MSWYMVVISWYSVGCYLSGYSVGSHLSVYRVVISHGIGLTSFRVQCFLLSGYRTGCHLSGYMVVNCKKRGLVAICLSIG